MTGSNEAERLAVRAPANLHTLDVKVATLKRLLDRRDGDGLLISVDRALIETAIAAVRKELSGVRDLLARIPDDAVDPYRATADAMAKTVVGLDKLLDTVERSIASGV